MGPLDLTLDRHHAFGCGQGGLLVDPTVLYLVFSSTGGRHAIHHFWVPDPSCLRQATVPVAHRAFRENGVRFNALDTFRRANRYHATAS